MFIIIQSQNDEDRQQQLRERARRLIAEARKGVVVTPSDDNVDRRSIDDQNNSPRRSMTPSTPGDRLSIKVIIIMLIFNKLFSQLIEKIKTKMSILFLVGIQWEFIGKRKCN